MNTINTGIGGIKPRNLGIDLARIAAMVMVCAVHVLNMGGVVSAAVGRSQSVLAHVFSACVYCAADCFAIVSGFVLADCAHFRVRGFFRLYGRVWSVGLLSALLATGVSGVSLSGGDWLSIVFPVLRSEFWYFTAYVAAFPFMPLLARGTERLSKGQLVGATVLIVSVFSLSSIVSRDDPFALRSGYSPIWLLALFLVGICLRRHGNSNNRPWANLAYFFAFAAATCATYAAKLAWPGSFSRAFGPHNPFLGYLSPTTVCSAVFLVRFFASLDIRPEGAMAGAIRFFAPAAFGVYLWQTQPVFFSRVFRDSFAFVGRFSVPGMAVALPCSAVAVFVVFAVLERARMWVFGAVERLAFRRGGA